jgi:hypothetical protein
MTTTTPEPFELPEHWDLWEYGIEELLAKLAEQPRCTRTPPDWYERAQRALDSADGFLDFKPMSGDDLYLILGQAQAAEEEVALDPRLSPEENLKRVQTVRKIFEDLEQQLAGKTVVRAYPC